MRLAILGALASLHEAPRPKKVKGPIAPKPGSSGPVKFEIARAEQVMRVMKTEVTIRLHTKPLLASQPPDEQTSIETEARDLLEKGDLHRLGLHLDSDGEMRISGYFGQFFTADYEVQGWRPDDHAEVRLVNEPRYTGIHKL